MLGRFDRAFSMPTTEKTLVARLNFTCSRRGSTESTETFHTPLPRPPHPLPSSLFPTPFPHLIMPRRASVQLAFVALFALVLAPALCDAQAVRRASPEEPSGRKRDRPGGPSHQVQRPPKYEHDNEHAHKPINGVPCEPETMCSTDHDCAADFPCTESECVSDAGHLFKLGYKNAVPQGMGVCVCFENKPENTPCIGEENVCEGPLGKCDAYGVCIPQPDDDGCPCAGKCSPPADACVDPDFPCICESGACAVNYLPPGGPCVPSTSTASDVKQCEEAICVKQATLTGGTFEVVCKVENRPDGTACSGDAVGTPATCENAGKCASGDCMDLDCQNIPPPPTCKEKFPDQIVGCTTQSCGKGEDCDQACADATGGKAACLDTPKTCNCNAPVGGEQTQFDCVLSGGGAPLPPGGRSRCCVCATPDT